MGLESTTALFSSCIGFLVSARNCAPKQLVWVVSRLAGLNSDNELSGHLRFVGLEPLSTRSGRSSRSVQTTAVKDVPISPPNFRRPRIARSLSRSSTKAPPKTTRRARFLPAGLFASSHGDRRPNPSAIDRPPSRVCPARKKGVGPYVFYAIIRRDAFDQAHQSCFCSGVGTHPWQTDARADKAGGRNKRAASAFEHCRYLITALTRPRHGPAF
ncbi:hypothetical protein Mame_04680 (plasmid) [Martelella mediterranea DSM 17316]|uniref:Uncharacterized protein n=1 Tax=Martelella mediterranea DSM 17316 TaxID=1122214 RepID=A0A1U9Z8R8_9HYPH|nr:hypothetical protein Mame_04680 [Martelella mediterranea DSM 17316]